MYNYRSAEKDWLKWKEAEEKELREQGADEALIQRLHEYDCSLCLRICCFLTTSFVG